MGLCTPTSTEVSSLPVCTFVEMAGLPLSIDPLEADGLSPEELLSATPAAAAPPKAGSPARGPGGGLADAHGGGVHGAEGPSADAKLDEPYSKLIYRAFLTRPDHTMTLQDIYQWFRENTNKAVSAKGG